MMGLVAKIENSMHRRRRRFRLRLNFNRQRLTRGLHIVPNLFTLCNAFFGFSSVVFAAHGDFTGAAYFILLGALMDGLDGRIARYMKVTSELGMQLDSLCDAISFCFAPSILLYFWQLSRLGAVGFVMCSLFLLAGIVRLARFNLTQQQQFIMSTGVTTTVAGCFLATLIITLHGDTLTPLELFGFSLLVVTLSYLMVSKIPFPTFKKASRSTYGIAGACLLAFVITMGFMHVLCFSFIAYFAYALINALWLKLRKP